MEWKLIIIFGVIIIALGVSFYIFNLPEIGSFVESMESESSIMNWGPYIFLIIFLGVLGVILKVTGFGK